MLGIGSGSAVRSLLHRLSAAGNALGLGRRYPPGIGDFSARDRSFEGNALTSDRERFDRMIAQIDAEPRLALGGPTFGWMKAAQASIKAIRSRSFGPAVATPVLIATAGEDRVVSNEAHARVAAQLANVTCISIEGARHELLTEADRYRERFLRAFDDFIPP